MNANNRIELLAPARNAAIGHQAVLHGADAVYIGGPAFGARHGAGNDIRDIADLVEFAHRFHVRIYVALNTILSESELEPARKLAWQCWEAGVDALIVQDMGLLELDLPPIDLHASTQCDIRTADKARFLAEAGFSQLILARELSLGEISQIRAAVPEDVVLEHFIHGALCVAYSGQCYISHAQTGRSANRGDCSQACRLPYTLKDQRGHVVAFDKHLLSLKDNNQSNNLRALLDAGIRSFKIEGRYKDAAYVKNVTGHYRSLIDEILTERIELRPLSSGSTKLLFAPDPEKTFHRGATDYFSRGRQPDIGAFDTPGFVGLPLGTVRRIGPDWLELDACQTLANGDGVTYMHQRQVVGFQINRAELLDDSGWRIHPNTPVTELPGLHCGLLISRNRDHVWEQTLSKTSSERRIPVDAYFYDQDVGFTLRLTDSDGIVVSASIPAEHQVARNPEQAEGRLRQQLDRFGDSEFMLRDVVVAWQQAWFVPPSLINELRREAVAQLQRARLAGYPRPNRRSAVMPPTPYPELTITYLGNVYNSAARRFYERHGVRLVEAAFEAHQERNDVSLMITKHCLRFSFSLCPKQAKGIDGVQGQIRAEPMTLIEGNNSYRLEFDCKACEMHVIGKIDKHVIEAGPPSS